MYIYIPNLSSFIKIIRFNVFNDSPQFLVQHQPRIDLIISNLRKISGVINLHVNRPVYLQCASKVSDAILKRYFDSGINSLSEINLFLKPSSAVNINSISYYHKHARNLPQHMRSNLSTI